VNRKNMRAFYGMADVLFAEHKYMMPIHLLEEALRVDPENPETMKKIGDIYMGSTNQAPPPSPPCPGRPSARSSARPGRSTMRRG